MELYNLMCVDLPRLCEKYGTEVMGENLAYGRVGQDLPDELKEIINHIINLINSGHLAPYDDQVFKKCKQKYGADSYTILETLAEALDAIRLRVNM